MKIRRLSCDETGEEKMIKYPSIAANTVSAERQVNQTISYLGTDGYKVLIVGNSITRHSPKPDIGWEADWGMLSLIHI